MNIEKRKIETKYHNDINMLQFFNVNEVELNLFFTLCYKIKDIKDSEREINISFKELKSLITKSRSDERFVKVVRELADKLLKIPYSTEKDNKISSFILFTGFVIDIEKKDITLEVHDKLRYLIKDLTRNYTVIDLKEFIEIKTTYAKNLYRILKQWQTTKEISISVDKIKRLLVITEGYSTGEMNRTILDPAIKELLKTETFKYLRVEKEKKGGNTITGYNFNWKVPNEVKLIEEKKEEKKSNTNNKVQISLELKNMIESAEKNIYIKAYKIKPYDIKKLLEEYTEKEIIEGLKKAKRTIKTNFESLNYLKNSFEFNKKEELEFEVIVPPKVEKAEIVETIVQENEKIEMSDEMKKNNIRILEELKMNVDNTKKSDDKMNGNKNKRNEIKEIYMKLPKSEKIEIEKKVEERHRQRKKEQGDIIDEKFYSIMKNSYGLYYNTFEEVIKEILQEKNLIERE